MSHFGNIGHHLIVAIIDIYRPYTQWLGDVQWGHLMTHVCSRLWHMPPCTAKKLTNLKLQFKNSFPTCSNMLQLI